TERADVADAAIAHAAAQTAHHLEDHVGHRTAIWHAPFDPLGHELLQRHLALLEIAIRRSFFHGGETAHAANHFEASTFQQERFAGTFFGACEHRAHHHAFGAGRERLYRIARILDAAVGNHRDVGGAADGVDDGGDLRNTDAGHDAGRTNRSWTDADFHRVDAALGERASARFCRDVASHELR